MRTPTSEENATRQNRLRFIVEEVFGGVRSAARRLDISAAAVSLMASGKREIWGILDGLTRHSDIDVHWLVTGCGHPARTVVSPRDRLVPVYDHILEGPPGAAEADLSGDFTVAEPPVYRESLYALRVRPHMAITRSADERVAAGDLLFVDTDRRRFQEPQQVAGRLVAARVSSGDPARLVLARVRPPEAEGDAAIWTLDGFDEKLALQVPAAELEPPARRRSPRKLGYVTGEDFEHLRGGPPPKNPRRRVVPPRLLAVSDIVGVCVVLRRSL